MDVSLFRLSIAFTLVAGTGAGVLAALSREVGGPSPFETTRKLLVGVMSIVMLYHGGLFVGGSETPVLEALRVLGYASVAVTIVAAASELRGVEWRPTAFEHRYVFAAAIGGLLIYAVGGPLSEVLYPTMLHWVHGLAALCAIAGLYGPVHDDVRTVHDDLQSDPSADRRSAAGEGPDSPGWMVPMDEAILEVLAASELVLTPAVVAYNLERSREEVNRRLRTLQSEGFVERLERGKYRLSGRGRRHLGGDVDGAA